MQGPLCNRMPATLKRKRSSACEGISNFTQPSNPPLDSRSYKTARQSYQLPPVGDPFPTGKSDRKHLEPSNSTATQCESYSSSLITSADSTTPPASHASHPLTKANLYLHTYNMPLPKTTKIPGRSTSTTTPTNPSKATSSTTAKLPLHYIFAANRMRVKDTAAQEKYPQVLEWAETIQLGERNSVTKAESERRIRERAQEYADANEDTWMRMFFTALKKETRDKRIAREWVAARWDQDGLREAWNQLYLKGSIPKIDATDALTKAVLNKNPRIKNPKPDITFGLSKKEFSDELTKINSLYYHQAGICPSLFHPFCIVEGKMKGTMEDAVNQCVRGGAALVNAARQLHYLSGDLILDARGADLMTPVFSLAAVPTSIALHVHWAEVNDIGQTWFHMNHVYTYAIENRGVGLQLRHDLNNILDWGTLSRKHDIVKMVTKIANALTAGTIRQLPTPEVSEIAQDENEDEDDGDDDNDNDDDDISDVNGGGDDSEGEGFTNAIEGLSKAGGSGANAIKGLNEVLESDASHGGKKRKVDERA